MSALLWSLLAVPAAGGAGLVLAGLRRSPAADRLAPRLAVAVAAVTLVLAILAAVLRPVVTAPLLAGIPAGFAVDRLSGVLVVMVAAVTLVVLLFAGYEFAADEPRSRFCGLMLLFAGAMLATVTATNLGVLLMGWEVMGAMSYALIAFHWREPAKVSAAQTAFVTTRTADLGLYLAAGAALAGAGSLAFDALAGARQPWLGLVTAGVIAAALGKSAQLPLSYWLSAAMQGPSGVSALLHSATMVAAGGYLLLRLEPLLAASGFGAPLVAWLGALTALLLGAVAVVQTEIKQLLAASTAAQLGFVVLAAGVGASAGGAAQLVAHAAVKSLLFLAAGAWLLAAPQRLVRVAFTVGALALAGLPPLPLWTAKDLVLAGARHETPALYLVGLAAGILSALYAGRALVLVWRPAEQTGRHAVTAWLPLALLAGATLALSVLAVPDLHHWLGSGPAPTAGEMALSAVLAIAAFGTALAARSVPSVRLLREWPALPRAAGALVARPTHALAEALARFDDRGLDAMVGRLAGTGLATARFAARADDSAVDAAVGRLANTGLATARMAARADDGVVDGGVRGTAGATLALAEQARARAERGMGGAVAGLAAGARWLGQLARRPQTGQLHTYYAQATAALLVIGVALVVVVWLTGGG